MLRARWLAVVLGCSAAVALAACGPNALPKASRTPAAAPAVAGSSSAAAAPQAPVAQLFGRPELPGRLLVVRDGDLWVWEKGSAHELAVGSTWHQPRWSPDGSRIAYVYQANNFSDIFVTDAKGTSQARLTRSQSTILEDNDWNLWPTWSPDGRRIAFVSDTSTPYPTLWSMDPDGSARRPIQAPGLVQEIVDGLAWSPDGAFLAAAVYSGGPSQVVLVPMAAGSREPARAVTDHPGGSIDPAWSPDGRWVAYAARGARGMDVYVVHPDGSGRQPLGGGNGYARAPAWSSDGKHLAYLSARTGAFEVWVVDVSETASGKLEARNERQLTRELSLDATSGISWGP